MIRRIRPVSRVIKIETEVRPCGPGGLGEHELPGLDRVWFPAVDIYEREDAVVVEIELAGVFKKDIKVTLAGNRVRIKGLKKEIPGEGGARFHRLERAYGTFDRTIFVPSSVLADKTSATLENGILTIVLKKPPRRSREVEVKIDKGGD
jgi:HSP20 family protein